jgi:ABC-type amino acid transport substrate-binding protein
MFREKLWRRMCAVTTGAVVALGLASCGSSNEEQAAEFDQISIGSDLTYPPYAYLDGDTPAGLDPEIGNALAEEMGVTVDYVDTRFEQLIPGLQSGRFDIILSSLYITAERAEVVDYVPYFTTGTSILAQSSNPAPPATLEDLCGLTVGSIKGSAILPSLRGEASDACAAAGKEGITVAEYPTDPEASQALVSGQVDVQLTEAGVAKEAVERTNGQLQITSTELLYPIAVGIAVKRGNTELKEEIQAALDSLKENGTYEEILKTYNVEPADEALVEDALGN